MIELGAGNGLNLGHYPSTVTEVVAIEPEDRLRGLAEQAGHRASVPVRVLAAHADNPPFDDGCFDAAVVSLVLCSLPDPRTALTELGRVLAPGGRLRFFEHVRSTGPLRGLAQDLVTPLWSRIGGGCHLNRDTTSAIRDAGFVIEELDRVVYAPMKLAPPQAHILGWANAQPIIALGMLVCHREACGSVWPPWFWTGSVPSRVLHPQLPDSDIAVIESSSVGEVAAVSALAPRGWAPPQAPLWLAVSAREWCYPAVGSAR